MLYRLDQAELKHRKMTRIKDWLKKLFSVKKLLIEAIRTRKK